jgi:hypothetical protein
MDFSWHDVELNAVIGAQRPEDFGQAMNRQERDVLA